MQIKPRRFIRGEYILTIRIGQASAKLSYNLLELSLACIVVIVRGLFCCSTCFGRSSLGGKDGRVQAISQCDIMSQRYAEIRHVIRACRFNAI